MSEKRLGRRQYDSPPLPEALRTIIEQRLDATVFSDEALAATGLTRRQRECWFARRCMTYRSAEDGVSYPLTTREIAKLFGVPETTVRRYVRVVDIKLDELRQYAESRGVRPSPPADHAEGDDGDVGAER